MIVRRRGRREPSTTSGDEFVRQQTLSRPCAGLGTFRSAVPPSAKLISDAPAVPRLHAPRRRVCSETIYPRTAAPFIVGRTDPTLFVRALAQLIAQNAVRPPAMIAISSALQRLLPRQLVVVWNRHHVGTLTRNSSNTEILPLVKKHTPLH